MISVCLATYNGKKYIKEQIDSILCQLGEKDELTISDDGSQDSTIEIVKSIADDRIKILFNQYPNAYTGNFYNAIQEASGDYIFLSDQDDIWLENKVMTMVQYLDKYDFVHSDAIVVDEKKQILCLSRNKEMHVQNMKKNILIMGGELCNKGAQAMLFTVVSELRKKYSDDYKIYVLSNEDFRKEPKEKYQFEFISMSYLEEWRLAGNEFKIVAQAISVFNRHYDKCNEERLKSILKNSFLCIDISGFALSSQWGYKHSAEFLVRFSLLKKWGIKSIVLPQSFGPFMFGNPIINMLMKIIIKHYLSYCSCIYARENEGYKLLTEYIGLKNVKKSPDLVLQSTGFQLTSIYKMHIIENEHHVFKGSVAIIPNYRNFEYGNQKDIEKYYFLAIQELIKCGKKIYLIHHSNEDKVINEKIKQQFLNNEDVIMVYDELACYEFENFVKQLDFVIASRFHSIVHAYKESVPCIVLGWATKYKELCETFSQEEYMLDVRNVIDFYKAKQQIANMNNNFQVESGKIEEKLEEIQKSSCFDFLDEY